MTSELKARTNIDKMLIDAGYMIQDMEDFNRAAVLGVAVREFQTNSGPVDYLLFIGGKPCGIIEAKAEGEFLNYKPSDSGRLFSELFPVRRLNSVYIPKDTKVCISTIQRMYSILRGEKNG